MTADDELVLLRACSTPRSLSEITQLTGLAERRCRDALQSLKARRLVRLLRRRWSTNRAGDKYAQALSREAERKAREAEERRRRRDEFVAAMRGRLLRVMNDVETVVTECREIPLAAPQMQRLLTESEALVSIQQEVDAAPDEDALKELDRVFASRLPEAAALARLVHAQVARLGLLEIIRKPIFVGDLIWLMCTSCRGLQAGPVSLGGRYRCIFCGRTGRAFVPSQKSVKDYFAPTADESKDLKPQAWLFRRLQKALQMSQWPAPEAERLLKSFRSSWITPDELHFACSMWMAEYGVRRIVSFVFSIPPNYPYPWPRM